MASPIIRQIVGRLHVNTPDREVIEYVHSRFSDHGRKPENRENRKKFYREALAAHAENRAMYVAVMSGNIRETR